MLVGIEAPTVVVSRRTGVGNYTANLIARLPRLSERNGKIDFVYFSNRYGSAPEDDLSGLTEETIYPRDHSSSRTL